MSIKNIVTGQLAKITTYFGVGQVRDISTTGNITTAANLIVGGASELGPVGNVSITGGNVGEVLSTDGTGNLSWTSNPIYVVPPVYLVASSAGNNQSFSNTILASYNSNTDMTVFYNGSLLENTYYTLAGDVLTVNIPLQVGDGIDVVTTVSSNVNSIVTSAYGNSNVAAYLPTYIGSFPNLTGDVTTTANVTAEKVSLGTGNLQLVGNTVSSAASIITIDPLGDGTPAGNVVVAGNLQVSGTLTYNTVVNATTNDLQWIAANNAANPSAATGAGLSVGPAGAYATFTYNSGSNVWQSSLPLLANGGVNANGALSGVTTGSFSGDITTSSSIIADGNVTGGNINTAGQVVSTGNIAGGNLLTVGNVVGGLFVGDGGALSNVTGANISGVVANANYAAYAGNVTIANQPNITGVGTLTSLAVTGNITGGNIAIGGNITTDGSVTAAGRVTTTSVIANLESVIGTSFKLRTTTDGTTSYVQTGTGVGGSTGNIVFAPYFSTSPRFTINTANGTVTAAGDVYSSQGKLLAASITSPVAGQTLRYNGSQWVNDSGTGGGQIVVGTGQQNISFELPGTITFPYTTYNAWLQINIPNGIVVWNAMVTITNSNVPVVGSQYGWYYSLGGSETMQLLNIPAQFAGALGQISTVSILPPGANPSNVFRFRVNNLSGVNQIAYWGYSRVA